MCPTTTSESQCMTADLAPAALARPRLERTASYSASLLVIENWRWIAHSIISPFNDCSRTLTLLARWLDKPSIQIIHAIGVSSLSSPVVNSAMKLAKACTLIAIFGQYWTSNSPSSITHKTNHPAAFGLVIIFHNVLSIQTIMVCAWKYNLSFQATVISAKVSFSIRGYLPSAPRSARLV